MFAVPESESLPSWFEIFNQELIQVSSFSDHETFDHPVACEHLLEFLLVQVPDWHLSVCASF